ncbi:MAG: SRPBCC family protein, partial [Methyloceanibacter sp.]
MHPIMRLILGLGALAVILLGVAFVLPQDVTIARSVVINAPESAVFPYLNNMHSFADWSPWAGRDPQLTVAYSGPEQGKGAKVEWTSSKPSVGTGSMEIVESSPNRHIDLAVNFNGLDGTSYYEVVPSGSGSKVTWGFGYKSGTSPLKRWKGLLLDRYVGAEYRDALAKLKDKIETERKPMAPPPPTAT